MVSVQESWLNGSAEVPDVLVAFAGCMAEQEIGHMPLAGGDQPCECGAAGCWDLDVGARALLRHAGQAGGAADGAQGGDRVALAARVIGAASVGDQRSGQAVCTVAAALGRGAGALVNAHDPDVVGLSGLARDIYETAPAVVRARYLAALMRFRRAAPPALVPS